MRNALGFAISLAASSPLRSVVSISRTTSRGSAVGRALVRHVQAARPGRNMHAPARAARYNIPSAFAGKSESVSKQEAMMGVNRICILGHYMRLLLDFFYPRVDPQRSRYDDIFVSDYFPQGRLPSRSGFAPQDRAILQGSS